MTDKLPTKLTIEPLLDALFELRFTSAVPASSIFPGFLFSKLPGDKTIERLPTEQLPKALLESDQNLRFAPLVRLHWGQYQISIGDRSVAVSCKMPYPGWGAFKPTILDIVNKLEEIASIRTVHRFSMKYTDLIPANDLADQISAINGTVVIGNHKLTQETFSLRVEIPKDELINIVQINSSAIATLQDGTNREGIVVDIDTIRDTGDVDFSTWLTQLPEQLELIHSANKAMFFECLHKKTIDLLGPSYD